MSTSTERHAPRPLSEEEQRSIAGGFVPSTGDPIPYPLPGILPRITPLSQVPIDA